METDKPDDESRAYVIQRASKGGIARAERLSPEERSEIARRASSSRWGTLIPTAYHTGEIVIAGKTIACAVLETGKRILTQETFLSAIGRSVKPKGSSPDGLPPFLAAENLKPFISDELSQATVPIVFRTPRTGEGRGQSGKRALGYDALLLPMVCEVYLNARDAGKTTKQQEHIVKTCDLLIRGFARVGIIALIDEATGYQEFRAKEELRQILEEYLSKDLRPYVRMFPEEFFKQIYRLHGWPYRPGVAQRTPLIGHLINIYIYEKLPPPVLPELRRRNPVTAKGYRKYKHSQFLSAETGIPELDRQIAIVTMLMRVSDDKEDFEANFERAFAKEYQPRLPLRVDVGTAAANGD